MPGLTGMIHLALNRRRFTCHFSDGRHLAFLLFPPFLCTSLFSFSLPTKGQYYSEESPITAIGHFVLSPAAAACILVFTYLLYIPRKRIVRSTICRTWSIFYNISYAARIYNTGFCYRREGGAKPASGEDCKRQATPLANLSKQASNWRQLLCTSTSKHAKQRQASLRRAKGKKKEGKFA